MDFRKILPILGVLVVAAAAALFYKSHMGGSFMGAGPVTTFAPPAGGGPAPASDLLAVSPDDMVLGATGAPVTIVEYASLTCPHCAHFTTDTLPQLKSTYIDTGKVKLVFRDFPLDPLALRAAMLAHCAGKGRYYGFVEVLFQNQKSWAEGEDPDAALAGIAKIGGIGKEQFDHCMADDALAQRVTKSRFDAEKALEIQNTPTFFINGKRFPGAQPFEKFDEAIKPLLNNP